MIILTCAARSDLPGRRTAPGAVPGG